ncbi:MAG: hypothetical protein K6U11_04855 [bacterium]|nr:hypothetical protein [bacterium]
MSIWPKFSSSFFLIIFSGLCLLMAGGCAYFGLVSYPELVQEKKQLLVSGNFDKALRSLESGISSGNCQVLNLMEQGMIRHMQGDYQGSIYSFEQALALISSFEDRAVISARSVASQLLTLPMNDNAIPYYGYPFERVLINTYQAMNYLFLGNLEGARVEVRRADQRQTKELERHNKEVSEYQRWGSSRGIEVNNYAGVQELRDELQTLSGSTMSSFQNAFTYYLSGIIYELNGEYNDAYIDYKKAYQLSPYFTCVRSDLLRLSRKLGFQEEYAEWSSRFQDLLKEEERQWPAGSLSSDAVGTELILFYSQGFICQKEQIKLTLPINNSLVSIALPVYSRKESTASSLLRVQAFDSEARLGTTSEVVNLDTLAIKALEEQLPVIITRQLARIISKAAISRQVENNNLAFVATSLYNILSENADLRNWLMLPNNIQILRRRLSAGRHEFTWRLESRFGQVQSIHKTTVTLQDGDICLVNLRSVDGRLLANVKVLPKA